LHTREAIVVLSTVFFQSFRADASKEQGSLEAHICVWHS